METASNVFADKIKEILRAYIKQAHQWHQYNASVSIFTKLFTNQLLKDIDDKFKSELDTVATTLPQISWKVSHDMHFPYHFAYGEDIILNDVIPLQGLRIMASVPNSVFDVSLLEYYRSILDYCRENRTTFKAKKIFNLPDILNAVDFLLALKEIQEQLATLSKDETLNPNTRGATFTQEKFAQLLFLCLEISPEQSHTLFEQYASKIQVTTPLFTSVIASFSDKIFQWCTPKWTSENPSQQLAKEIPNKTLTQYIQAINNLNRSSTLEPEKVQAITSAFEDSINRIITLDKNIRWENLGDCVYISEKLSENSFFLCGALPLTGLKIMASVPNSEFDVSLLAYSFNALIYWEVNNSALKDKAFLNLSDILDGVDFLLNRKEIQEQLSVLIKEGTPEHRAETSAFTQEKFAKLLLLCRETNTAQGRAIFEQNESAIQVTTALLGSVVSWPSSDAPFQWCTEKWMSKNPKQLIPKEIMTVEYVNYMGQMSDIALRSGAEAETKTAAENFRNMLNRTSALNKKWEKFFCLQINRSSSGKAVVLGNVLPLAGLTIMESVYSNVFDASLLCYYYDALDYCRRWSDELQDKEILNLSDILSAIAFLLNKKEIQEQLLKLPTENEGCYSNQANIFTQEKFAQLLFLSREISPEQSHAIFEQHQSKIQVTVSLLASLASWSSNAPFENCLQRLDGNIPAGIVGVLTKKYTTELELLRNSSPNCPADETDKKAQEAYAHFKLGLSQMLAVSKQKPIICGEKDSGLLLSVASYSGERYIRNIIPIEAIQLMKEQYSIQLNPLLFLSYLSELVDIAEELEFEEKQGEQSQKIINYDTLLETIRFLKQDLDAEQLINAFKSLDDLYIALFGMSILQKLEFQVSEFYEPLYKKFCLKIKKQAATTQEYEIAHILKIANKYQSLELIALLSMHPHATISPDFLKISAEMNDYEGLACILEHRPEFLDKLSISNKMLTHSPRFEVIFQQRLKSEGEKHGACEKELKETFDALSAVPDIYVPDMVPTIIQIVRSKKLLNYSIEEVIDLAFGSFLSIWNKKGIPHPDELAVGKSGNSLLGSVYGYKHKSELHAYLLKKLRSILPNQAQNNPLSRQHKKFCFKLAVLFPDIKEVDAYFEQLMSKIDEDTKIWEIIEEASNFNIPKQGYWDIEAWFSFVKRNQFSSRYMAFLGAASDIDMKMALGDTIFSILRTKVPSEQKWEESILKYLMGQIYQKNKNIYDKQPKSSDLWNLVKKDLWENLTKQCPLAYENLIQQHSKKQRTREEVQNSLSQQKNRFALLLKNVLKMYDLYNPDVNLLSLVALRLQDITELPKEYKEAVLTALEHGYSNEDIKELIIYLTKNKQAFSFVPAVTVDGTVIDDGTGTNYNGYELKPLAKTDPMALVAGLKTRCCQHFKNAGKESAMHAYSSIYGATYRLASKKDPNIGDWLAQSWVVLSECGTILLFDSIEFAAHAKEKMVLAFFKKAAEKLLASNPHLQEIWVGASQHARLNLEKHGYTRKPAGENFSIAGYSEDSYTDAENIVVLLNRNELKIKSEEVQQAQEETSVVIHLNKVVLQTQEETKVNAEYRLRYGVDTYLKPGKVVKLLGLSDQARRIFNTTHAPVISLLMEEPENPLLEEGFVSSDPDNQQNRYREGECYITYKVTTQWLDNMLNPKIKEMTLLHHVYAAKEEDIPAVLQEAQQNISIKTFTVVVFIGIHAVSVFVDPKNSVCFIEDSEPGTNLTKLSQACKSMAPNMRVITPEADLRLQKDFYSCTTFALKSARYFAKNANAFSKLLMDNPTDTLATADMPAALLKMAQTPLTLTEEQNQTVVSKKKNLTLLQYHAAFKLTIGGTAFNTAALKTRQSLLKQMQSTRCL
jgi:hypothetical protein